MWLKLEKKKNKICNLQDIKENWNNSRNVLETEF